MKLIAFFSLFLLSIGASASFVEFAPEAHNSATEKPLLITGYKINQNGIELKTDKAKCIFPSYILADMKTSALEVVKFLESDSTWVVSCVNYGGEWIALSIEKR